MWPIPKLWIPRPPRLFIKGLVSPKTRQKKNIIITKKVQIEKDIDKRKVKEKVHFV